MRWVDRGPEPNEVEEYRRRYTPAWVEHVCKGMGQRGPDLENHWRDFRAELSSRFYGKCGYCERLCDATGSAPTVDHFRPKSKCPKLTYKWSNWIFSCRRCNDKKADRWPGSGFVDPCAVPLDERPENYFEIDLCTGEIVVKPGLPEAATRKAQNTIDCIGLNARDLCDSRRLTSIEAVTAIWAYMPNFQRELSSAELFDPQQEFAGITQMVVEQLRQTGEL